MAFPRFLSSRRKGVVAMLWTGPLALLGAVATLIALGGLINAIAHRAGAGDEIIVDDDGERVDGRSALIPWLEPDGGFAPGDNPVGHLLELILVFVALLLFSGLMLGIFHSASRAARGQSFVRAHRNSTFHVDDV